MNPDLERLLESVDMGTISKEKYDLIKSKLNEKLEKAEKYDDLSNAQKYNHCNPAKDGYCTFEKQVDDSHQQIKQLNDENKQLQLDKEWQWKGIVEWKELSEKQKSEIQSLKSQLEKYTKSIEFWKSQGLTDEQAESFKNGVDNSFLKECVRITAENEKLQKVIDEIKILISNEVGDGNVKIKFILHSLEGEMND